MAMEGFASSLQAEAKLNVAHHPHVTPWYILDPRRSQRVVIWDMVTGVALIFTALLTPFEVGFIPARGEVDGLFVFNRLIDFLFICDMCLQFLLMYPSAREGGRWVNEPHKIARNYICGWFTIDLFSILVSSFDIISITSSSTT